MWHGYVLVALKGDPPPGLERSARQRIRAALRRQNYLWRGKFPARKFQARASLDGTKALYEVTLDDVAKAIRDASRELPDVAEKVTYHFFALYGTWEDSRREALAYLAANREEWEA